MSGKAKPRTCPAIEPARVDLSGEVAEAGRAPRVETPGGRRTYVWIGNEHWCLGYLDDSRKIRALRDLCNEVLRSRGAKP